jgi:hypothetical protein
MSETVSEDCLGRLIAATVVEYDRAQASQDFEGCRFWGKVADALRELLALRRPEAAAGDVLYDGYAVYEEREKDAQRLDWLEANDASLTKWEGEEFGFTWSLSFASPVDNEYTIRQAIDAAIDKDGGK